MSRLDGPLRTPAGAPRTECEERSWLEVAPTRYEAMSNPGTTSEFRDDGLGLYRVDSERPRSITALEDDLGPSPLLPPHREATRAYDRDRIIAGSLGTLGVVAMGVGAGLFATSFSTRETGVAPAIEEEQVVDSGRAVTGSVLMALGFGISITGLAINPNHAERARAEAARYAFRPPADDPDAVVALIAEHNGKVRDDCARVAAPSEGAATEE